MEVTCPGAGSAVGRDVADIGDVAFGAGGLDGGEASLGEHVPRLLLAHLACRPPLAGDTLTQCMQETV